MEEEGEDEKFLPENETSPSTKELKTPLLSNSKATGTFVYTLAFFAGVGGFLFGYDTGVVSGALILLTKHFQLSFFMEELVVSITIGAAIIGAVTAGPICHYVGRKIALILASVVFTVGALCMALANNTETLLVGRAIVGISIGEYATMENFYSINQ